MVDIAVIGAGLAGLVCARQLQQAGYSVIVVEKSRGLGGRVATRRLHGTCADHGARYLEDQGYLSQQLIEALGDRQILHRWLTTIHRPGQDALLHPVAASPGYVASAGITAIAKFLATGLEIWRGQRVQAIAPALDGLWKLTLEAAGVEPTPHLQARALVMAIPAPQALALLEPLASSGLPTAFLKNLRSVEFEPCLSAIATYPMARQQNVADLAFRAIAFPQPSDLIWLSVESSKRPADQQPVLVVQSSAEFAQRYLDSPNLQPAGQQLLSEAAKVGLPWFNAPENLQVHRWRYAFASRSLPDPYLATTAPLPLVCSGDWCGGRQIEDALSSGMAAAIALNQRLDCFTTPAARFLE
jgi:renalase